MKKMKTKKRMTRKTKTAGAGEANVALVATLKDRSVGQERISTRIAIVKTATTMRSGRDVAGTDLASVEDSARIIDLGSGAAWRSVQGHDGGI